MDDVDRARQFFEQELPSLLTGGLVRKRQRKTLGFLVPPAGSWRVRLGEEKPELAVQAGSAFDVDATIVVTAKALCQWLKSGELPEQGPSFDVFGCVYRAHVNTEIGDT